VGGDTGITVVLGVFGVVVVVVVTDVTGVVEGADATGPGAVGPLSPAATCWLASLLQAALNRARLRAAAARRGMSARIDGYVMWLEPPAECDRPREWSRRLVRARLCLCLTRPWQWPREPPTMPAIRRAALEVIRRQGPMRNHLRWYDDFGGSASPCLTMDEMRAAVEECLPSGLMAEAGANIRLTEAGEQALERLEEGE